jgi:serine/threonine protein kinase
MGKNAELTCPKCRGDNDDNSSFCSHCGHSFETETPSEGQDVLAPGSRILEYRVDRLLGAGGMGQVYEATQVQLGERVAIKRMIPGLGDDPAILSRFLEEARTMTLLRHTNIVQLKQFFQEQGRYYLVMEYVSGISAEECVGEHIQRGELLPLDKAIDIATQIASALHHIHTREVTQTVQEGGREVVREITGIVHRDVKPSNIQLDKSGTPYLLDFGIARPDGRERMTRIGGVIGTYEYMAPEQIRGQPVTAQTDQYALGATLFYLLTGKSPFPQTTDTGINAMEGHLHSELPSLSQFRQDVPASVQLAMKRAMSKRPEDRFPDCQEFARALSRHGGAGDAESATGLEPRSTAGFKWLAIGAIVAALVGVLVLAWQGDWLGLNSSADTQDSDGAKAGDGSDAKDMEGATDTVVAGAPSRPDPEVLNAAEERLVSGDFDGSLELLSGLPSDQRQDGRARSLLDLAETKKILLETTLDAANKMLASSGPQQALDILEDQRSELGNNQQFQETLNRVVGELKATQHREKQKQMHEGLLQQAQQRIAAGELNGALKFLREAEQMNGVSTGDATRLRKEVERKLAEIESRKVNWYCLCYKETIGGVPTPSTACRRDWEACQSLTKAIESGRRPFVANSISRTCRLVRGEYPWSVFGHPRAWKPSKKAGDWWSDRGCFIP